MAKAIALAGAAIGTLLLVLVVVIHGPMQPTFPEPQTLELKSCFGNGGCIVAHLKGHLMAAPVVLQEEENLRFRAEVTGLQNRVAFLEQRLAMRLTQ